jgi:hypothetical protein
MWQDWLQRKKRQESTWEQGLHFFLIFKSWKISFPVGKFLLAHLHPHPPWEAMP